MSDTPTFKQGILDRFDMTADPFEDRLARSGEAGSNVVSVFRFQRGADPSPKPDPAPSADTRPDDDGRSGRVPALVPVYAPPQRFAPTRSDTDLAWNGLTTFSPDGRHLARSRLIGTHRVDPAASAIDMLRTRLMRALADNGWSRVAITSPTHGCGKSVLAANLALSFARKPDFRTLLVDLDLRAPDLARLFGLADAGPLRDVLTGVQPIESHLHRIGQTLALALNDRAEADAAVLLQDPATAEALRALQGALRPDLVLYDMPPMLTGDDVIGFLPEVDGVLIVADATRTKARDITDCERLLEGRAALLGVVLNRAEVDSLGR